MNFLRRTFLREGKVTATAEPEKYTAVAVTCAYTENGDSTHLAFSEANETLCHARVTKHGRITDTDEIRFNLPQQDDSFHYCGECVENHTGIHRDLILATRKKKV